MFHGHTAIIVVHVWQQTVDLTVYSNKVDGHVSVDRRKEIKTHIIAIAEIGVAIALVGAVAKCKRLEIHGFVG